MMQSYKSAISLSQETLQTTFCSIVTRQATCKDHVVECLTVKTISESIDTLSRDGGNVQYMQYLSKCRKLHHKYAKSKFEHLVFLFESLYDQQDSYKCSTAM